MGVRRTGQDGTWDSSMGKALAVKPENSTNWNLIPEHHRVERRELTSTSCPLTSTYMVWLAHSSSPTLHALKINVTLKSFKFNFCFFPELGFLQKKNKPRQLAALAATADRMNEEPASSPLQLFFQLAGHSEHVRAVSKEQMGKEAVTMPCP